MPALVSCADAWLSQSQIISRALRRSLDGYEKNYFTGPPESTRDYCVVAARALAKGDWKRTEELLLGLPAWSLLQNSEGVKTMLKRKIQEEGLRTYIFTYSPHYTAMSLEELSNIFELPQHNGTAFPLRSPSCQLRQANTSPCARTQCTA